MLNNRFIALGVLVATVLACGQDASPVITGPSDAPSLNGLRDGGSRRPAAFAMGHAEVEMASIADKYTFLAIRDVTGAARGAFEWSTGETQGNVSGRGRVLCLTVVGNIAHIAGVFEESDAPWITPVNNYAVWSVEDNGTAPQDVPDRVSLLHGGLTEAQATFHCANGANGSFLGMAPNQRGEIVVNDGTVFTRANNDDE